MEREHLPVSYTKKMSQHGFTLIEVAISLFVTGIMFSGALLIVTNMIQAQKVTDTKSKLVLIESALSSYAQQHYRLPCPADPQAADGRESFNGNCFKNTSNADLYWATEGIVPWKELGIPQEKVVDAWGRYITYKPAPQLTVDNTSSQMLNTPDDPSVAIDTHNACRGAIWYDAYGKHISRAKALFCCNADPKQAYITNKSLSALSNNWKQTGIVDTQTAKTTNAGGTSMPGATTVALTNNWKDSNSEVELNGRFLGANGNRPQPPLLRATGLAVTLVSHGNNGTLAFLAEQNKNKLTGGATVTPAAGGAITGTSAPLVETANIWPANVFSGVFGHPKVSDGSYDQLNSRSTSSDDIVTFLRSDDLFGLVGQGSCLRPPAPLLQQFLPCKPQPMTMTSTTFDPNGSSPLKMDAITLTAAATQNVKYTIKTSAVRLTDEAGYNNSLGAYVIDKNGVIKNVGLIEKDMKSLNIGAGSTLTLDVPEDNSSIGTFILPNGLNVNNKYTQQVADSSQPSGYRTDTLDTGNMKMIYNFGKSDARPATVKDSATNITLVAPNIVTGKDVPIYGANNDSGGAYNSSSANNGVYHMYSNLNYNEISRGWRDDPATVASKTVLKSAGVDSTDNTKINAGFEDLSAIQCYYTNDGSCVPTKPAKGTGLKNAKLDQYGGYEAKIGDNDYDDVAATMSVMKCSLQN